MGGNRKWSEIKHKDASPETLERVRRDAEAVLTLRSMWQRLSPWTRFYVMWATIWLAALVAFLWMVWQGSTECACAGG